MDRVLLLVDDELDILRSLSRTLRKENYEIITANSGEEALEILDQRSVSVILTDQRMPTMKGTELLAEVKNRSPQTIRMVLTGHAELDLVTAAINESSIYRFLEKPWDNQVLKENIRDAFYYYEKKHEKAKLNAELKRLNEELNNLNDALQQQVEEKSAELIKVSQYDFITQLPNRLLLSDRLSQTLLHAIRQGGDVAVVIIGLNGMTLVNDSHGHETGDDLLRAVAQRLIENVRACDTVARFTGDEFAIVLDDLKDLPCITETIVRLQQKMLDPYEINAQEIYISNSIGISLHSNDGENGEDLIHAARTAMRTANAKGASNYCYYSPVMNQQAHDRLALERDLHKALEREEFIVFYQPQVDIETGTIISAEALVRWQHPEKGMVSPISFIPILEDTGLIDAVGEWVLRRSCEQINQWREQNLSIQQVSVNISLHQLQAKNFLSIINNVINEYCVDGKIHMLELEVTESMAMAELESTVSILKQLGDLGIKVAIDDFGTGYASLSYLTQLPVHTLKIDKCFIDRIFTSSGDAAIVAGVIAMAHTLGLIVVAEGVETNEQAEFLRNRGCDVIQGYLYGKPISAEELTQKLSNKPN